MSNPKGTDRLKKASVTQSYFGISEGEQDIKTSKTIHNSLMQSSDSQDDLVIDTNQLYENSEKRLYESSEK